MVKYCLVNLGAEESVECYRDLDSALRGYEDMIRGLISNDMIPCFDDYGILPKKWLDDPDKELSEFFSEKQYDKTAKFIEDRMHTVEVKFEADMERIMKEQRKGKRGEKI